MKELLTLQEAAKEFTRRGLTVSARTVNRWHSLGKIKSCKPGLYVRIPLTAIDEFISKNTKFQS